MRNVVVILVVIGVVACGAAYYVNSGANDPASRFRTATIERGDLTATIGATGTLEPEKLVDVGAQVAGRIKEFGKDVQGKPIDFNSEVEAGTVLALIDPTFYEAALREADAMFARSKADLVQLEAKCAQAEAEWKRAQRLRPMQAISETDYDAAEANCKVAEANIKVGQATIQQSEAARAAAKTNLDYTTIVSPVRGKIIARRVDIGQTVVASLNAPSLFLIAKDLRRIEVWALVNEADIGQIHEGMPARFTVDTYPGETFHGTVRQVRLDATTTSNIVTYTVVVTTDNSSGKLLPYLTASVEFEVDHRTNVLRVPNAALRWKPDPSKIEPGAERTPSKSAESPPSQERGCLWVETSGGLVRPLHVVVGATDGTMTEISGEGVKEGVKVVVGDVSEEEEGAAAGKDKESNPFLPKLPKGPRRGM
jgi:HlyD family secretion protein